MYRSVCNTGKLRIRCPLLFIFSFRIIKYTQLLILFTSIYQQFASLSQDPLGRTFFSLMNLCMLSTLCKLFGLDYFYNFLQFCKVVKYDIFQQQQSRKVFTDLQSGCLYSFPGISAEETHFPYTFTERQTNKMSYGVDTLYLAESSQNN